jgi:hypothetical protein
MDWTDEDHNRDKRQTLVQQSRETSFSIKCRELLRSSKALLLGVSQKFAALLKQSY